MSQPRIFARWSAQLFSHLVALSGILASLAWMLGFWTFQATVPDKAPISLSASLAFLLTGLSLIILNFPSTTPARRITVIFLTGNTLLLVLISTLSSFAEFGTHLTFLKNPLVLPQGFQMSYTSSVEFLLAGVTILGLSGSLKRHSLFRRFITGAIFLIAMFALASIALTDPGQMAIKDFQRMHALTAGLFILTAAALFFSDENDSIVTLMRQRGRGTRIAQLLFILSFTIPLLTEMLVHPIIHSGRLDHGNSKAIGVLLNGIIFATMAILMGRWIRRSERLAEESHLVVKNNEELLRQLFEVLPVGILILTKQGKVAEANQAAYNLTGIDASGANIRGIPAATLFDSAGKEVTLDAMVANSAARLNQESDNQAYLVKRSDGSERWLTLHSTPIDIETLGTIVVMTDITGVKETEASLSDSGQRLRELLARLTVVEAETRKQAAMLLHDQVGQNLTALIISLQYLSHNIASGDSGAVNKTLEDALTILKETVRKTKSIIYELRPSVLDDYGLYPALQWYAGQLSGRTAVNVTAEGHDLLQPLPSATENAIFRIVQEACTNSLRHSGATSIAIILSEDERRFRLEVRDDGCGFDPEDLYRSGNAGLGLTGMRERAHLTGGTLEILSKPGQGTRITLTIKKER